MRLVGTSGSAVTVIARNLQSHHAGTPPSEPIRQRFGFCWWRKSETLRAMGAAGRALDLIIVK